MSRIHGDIYKRDNERGPAHGWIQWKGTEVCIDLHCVCGHHGHFDGGFFYFYECPRCAAKYALGQNVKLIPLTEAEAEYAAASGAGLKSDDQEAWR